MTTNAGGDPKNEAVNFDVLVVDSVNNISGGETVIRSQNTNIALVLCDASLVGILRMGDVE